jgi:hypothetical protein
MEHIECLKRNDRHKWINRTREWWSVRMKNHEKIKGNRIHIFLMKIWQNRKSRLWWIEEILLHNDSITKYEQIKWDDEKRRWENGKNTSTIIASWERKGKKTNRRKNPTRERKERIAKSLKIFREKEKEQILKQQEEEQRIQQKK